MKIICVIPARAGSKRLKDKNIFPFLDKPLVQHTIETARKLTVDEVVVSTDSNEIAELALKYEGVGVRNRPPELAIDTATTDDVVIDVAKYYSKTCGGILLLQPTSPILRTDELEKAISIFKEKNLPALVSVNIDAKFSGGYILVRLKDLLEQGTLWVKGLHIKTANFGDIDDLSDLRCLEAFLQGRIEDYDKFPVR